LRRRDRDEIGTPPSGVRDNVGDSVLTEYEMPPRLLEGRVNDRVLDRYVGHCPGRITPLASWPQRSPVRQQGVSRLAAARTDRAPPPESGERAVVRAARVDTSPGP